MTKKDMAAVVVITAVAALVMYVTGIGCPILFFTGIPCFGCGMSRACLALLHLDYAAAWYYHPMIFLIPVIVVVLFFYNRFPKRLFRSLAALFIILFIVVYLVRLMDPEHFIKWNISDGFIYKQLIK